MTHEEKKTAKIVEELTIFFFALGAEHVSSDIQRTGTQAVISFEADYHPMYADKVEKLDQYLNGQKNDGREDIYWELAGSGDPGETSQLLLVGMMIDRAEIEVKDRLVRLKLYRETVS